MSHQRRQTEVDIFGTEQEMADYARQRKLSREMSTEIEIAEEDNLEPDDEAGSMSRKSYQRTTIDVILAMLVMLVGIMLFQ